MFFPTSRIINWRFYSDPESIVDENSEDRVDTWLHSTVCGQMDVIE